MKYPVYKPSLSDREKNYVIDCLETNWISSKGKYVTEFENSFAKYLGVNQATGVCNGTVALHLALLALDIQSGDEVIVPTLTYIASVNAIKYVGATPIFVDSVADTWQLDPEDVKRKISSRTKAIMVVHLYGLSCDMEAIGKLAAENDLKVIEDVAEALGSELNGEKMGSLGDVATFSFYGNKTLTTGEGGMVVSNSPEIMDKIVHLKGQGLAKDREYWHDVIGYNYRLTNICAAIGLAQLERIERIIDKKRAIAELYSEAFENSDVAFFSETAGIRNAYWMCNILTKTADDRDPLREHLKNNGIETRPVFCPIHTMPMYNSGQSHPIAQDIASRGISLPSYPELTSDDVAYIADKILSK